MSAILVVALVVATVIGFAALLLDHAPVGLPLILAGAVGGGAVVAGKDAEEG